MFQRGRKTRFAYALTALAVLALSWTAVFHTHKIDSKAADQCATCAGHQQLASGLVFQKTSPVSPFWESSPVLGAKIQSDFVSFSSLKPARAPPLDS